MADRMLAEILKRMIENRSTSVGPVQNLLGTLAEVPVTDEISRVAEWSLFFLSARGDGNQLLPPDTIVDRVVVQDVPATTTVRASGGVLTYTPAATGMMLYATVVVAPQAFSFPIEVEAPGHTIGIYIDEVLVRSGVGKVKARLSVTDSFTSVNVVTTGSPVPVKITLPSDISAVIRRFAPDTPTWRTPTAITTNYVDPNTGATGNALYWYDQPKAGGWNVYRVTLDDYGIVGGVSRIDNQYVLRGTSPVPPPRSGYMQVDTASGTEFLGAVTDVRFNTELDSGTPVTMYIDAASEYEETDDMMSGTLQCIRFRHILDVKKAGSTASDNTITFVDTDVEAGVEYSYTLDAYAAFDPSLRSEKSVVRSVTAGDTTAPGAITVDDATVIDGQLYMAYTPPSDTDYAGCHVYYDNAGTLESLLVDYGTPDVADSLVLNLVDSGTYYFAAFDQVGNEQNSGEAAFYAWDSLPNYTALSAPILSVRQLSSADTVTDGEDPTRVARFELTASHPSTPIASLRVDYWRVTDDAWQEVAGSSLPVKVNISRTNKENWIRVRAYDTVYATLSDELVFRVDYDTTPEIASLFGHIKPAEDKVEVKGAVDDDARSLNWYVVDKTDTTGPVGSDPTEAARTAINNKETTKTFDFEVDLDDGQRKEIRLTPYDDTAAAGTAGLYVDKEFIRPPRTLVFFAERSKGGEVKRDASLVTLIPVPPSAIIYKRVDPVYFGTINSADGTTMTDDDAAVWTADQYNTNYEVTFVSGANEGDVQTITDTVSTTLTVAGWETTPSDGDKYHIREAYRQYNETGTASSAGSFTLTDSSKTWVVNVFRDKWIEILENLGQGQQRKILSNTTDTVTLYPVDQGGEDWNDTPNGTSRYKIDGAMHVTKDENQDKVVSFYASMPDIVNVEEARSIVVDHDSKAEIGSMSLIESDPGELLVSLTAPDDDVKNWALHARKGNWPTTDLLISGSLDPEFLRFSETKGVQTIQLNVASGEWYVAVTPYDSYNDAGPRLADMIEIEGAAGGGPTDPALVSQSVSVTSPTNNRVAWTHNSVAEAAGPFTCYITIYAYRTDKGYGTGTYIVGSGANREIHTDASGTVDLAGSFDHTVARGTKWTTWNYTLKIYKTSFSTLIDTYTTTHSGNYLQDGEEF